MVSRSLLLPLALLLSTPVLAQNSAPPPSTREVPDFQGVAVGQGLHAELRRGAKAVRVEGPAKDVARLELVVKDGILTTRVARGAPWSSGGLGNVRIFISSPRLESIQASGGAHVDAMATAVTALQVEASGGSSLKLSGVESGTLNVEASGGSQVTLQGRVDQLELEGSGGSGIHARELQVGALKVNASGGTTLEVSPSQSLAGTLSGGSTLTSASRPASIQVERSGGSSVRYE